MGTGPPPKSNSVMDWISSPLSISAFRSWLKADPEMQTPSSPLKKGRSSHSGIWLESRATTGCHWKKMGDEGRDPESKSDQGMHRAVEP